MLLYGVFSLFARDVEIIVHDHDLSIPLEGAVVRSWDGSEHICDMDGIAVIQAPENRQVIIHVTYPGYGTGRAVIPVGHNSIIVNLHISNILESRELVIEGSRPGTGETQTGRSIALTGREITQAGEVGIVEDVMGSIKLLPGVGYAGFFNAQPSIRGGDPGDLRASLDGFYVFHPYHWGGGFSIFSPRMIESAQLSHGVFSSRFGHTITGLLEVSSKKPSPTETEFEFGASTSMASLSLSVPIAKKGGILFMGNITYYDPIIWMTRQLSKVIEIEALQTVNAISVAPYIRSTAITGNYRFADNLELSATGFFGMDGIGINLESSDTIDDLNTESQMKLDWTNYQVFFTSSLAWNPSNQTLFKFTAGAGYMDAIVDANLSDNIKEKGFSGNGWFSRINSYFPIEESYSYDTRILSSGSDKAFNVQGRIDFDWELKNGFLVSLGVQELYMRLSSTADQEISSMEMSLSDLSLETQDIIFWAINAPANQAERDWLLENLYVSFPLSIMDNMKIKNHALTSSAYALVEYASPNKRFNTELGLRLDHFYITDGKNLSLQSKPILNPRLNIDFNVFQNRWIIESFNLSAGSGLFSSIDDMVLLAEEKYNFTRIVPNRSLTSVLGARLEFFGNIIFNIEGYYKHIFDRTYISLNYDIEGTEILPRFDGEGRVWGIDVMLQRKQSRFLDGWLSYSFNWTKYRNPNPGMDDAGFSGGDADNAWYYPTFHRFHNLNLVLNIKPKPNIGIFTRFGVASGTQLPRRIGSKPKSSPVFVFDPENPGESKIIEKFYWPEERDESNRIAPSFLLDVKISIFGSHRNGKARSEVYFALENLLAFIGPVGNSMYNQYTGEVYTGMMANSYEMPIPIPSFGIKFSY